MKLDFSRAKSNWRSFLARQLQLKVKNSSGARGRPRAHTRPLHELRPIQLRIRTAGFQQFLMRALLDDGAGLHYQNQVRIHNG